MGKNAMVKLTYTKEFRAGITATTKLWTNISYPTSAITFTYPAAGTISSIAFLGSHFCTPLGSATLGYTEDYPSGLVDWSSFYEEAIVFGSSMSVTMMPTGSAASTTVGCRWVLLAIASTDPDDVNAVNAGAVTKTELDALDYEDLSSYPGARSGYIRSGFAGVTRVKQFRKTKHMLGLKDITDNQLGLAMRLPTSVAIDSGANYTTNAVEGTELSWIWYFRVFPMSLEAQTEVMYTFRINYYTQLQSRGLILQETANVS